MPVSVRPNPFHPTRDVAVLTEPWTPDELRAAARTNVRPLSAKAVPGSDKHRRLMAAGARVYQQCPALHLDAGSAGVQQWCDEHATLPVVDMRARDPLALWVDCYEVVHRSWSPTAPHEELMTLFGELAAEIDRGRSVVCEVAGEVVAAAFVFSDDDPPEIICEALLPEHPRARDAVASCLAAALRGADSVVLFDGHVSDPHFYPLWQTVPGVYAGDDDPEDLLEIPADA